MTNLLLRFQTGLKRNTIICLFGLEPVILSIEIEMIIVLF